MRVMDAFGNLSSLVGISFAFNTDEMPYSKAKVQVQRGDPSFAS